MRCYDKSINVLSPPPSKYIMVGGDIVLTVTVKMFSKNYNMNNSYIYLLYNCVILVPKLQPWNSCTYQFIYQQIYYTIICYYIILFTLYCIRLFFYLFLNDFFFFYLNTKLDNTKPYHQYCKLSSYKINRMQSRERQNIFTHSRQNLKYGHVVLYMTTGQRAPEILTHISIKHYLPLITYYAYTRTYILHSMHVMNILNIYI